LYQLSNPDHTIVTYIVYIRLFQREEGFSCFAIGDPSFMRPLLLFFLFLSAAVTGRGRERRRRRHREVKDRERERERERFAQENPPCALHHGAAMVPDPGERFPSMDQQVPSHPRR
jgi:hypothetical protein